MIVKISEKDLESLITAYSTFDGYMLDDPEDDKVFQSEAKRYLKILNEVHNFYYGKDYIK